jgi:hypothetical protein
LIGAGLALSVTAAQYFSHSLKQAGTWSRAQESEYENLDRKDPYLSSGAKKCRRR